MGRSLAVVGTIPGREQALEACLASLRPQVDTLRVICHDMLEPPAAVRHYADAWACEPDRFGSAAKLRWSEEWEGLYLACDDDLRYPPDYAEKMASWVKRWKGRALVTAHGRILAQRAERFTDTLAAVPPRGRSSGGWLNYPGACALAWDTRLRVPSEVPGKNLEEAHLAVWAQRSRVPIWLVPHAPEWLEWLLEGKNLPTIWAEEKGVNFANRNAVLAPIAKGRGWRVFQCR